VVFTDFFTLRRAPEAAAPEPDVQQVSTKVLARFLSAIEAFPEPVLLDLGPVVGGNITFFGEGLGCKVVVEDLFADIDQHAREGRTAELPEFFSRRFPPDVHGVDGILCWDVFDYLERDAAGALADKITGILRPGGMLLAFFNTANPPPTALRYTKHLVIDHVTLEHRPYAAACGKRRPVMSREVERLFTPLRVVEQFLLNARVREVLFRKPGERTATESTLVAAAH
jgi:hypothetical protein